MTSFDESAHPRGAGGRFTTKPAGAPVASLDNLDTSEGEEEARDVLDLVREDRSQVWEDLAALGGGYEERDGALVVTCGGREAVVEGDDETGWRWALVNHTGQETDSHTGTDGQEVARDAARRLVDDEMEPGREARQWAATLLLDEADSIEADSIQEHGPQDLFVATDEEDLATSGDDLPTVLVYVWRDGSTVDLCARWYADTRVTELRELHDGTPIYMDTDSDTHGEDPGWYSYGDVSLRSVDPQAADRISQALADYVAQEDQED